MLLQAYGHYFLGLIVFVVCLFMLQVSRNRDSLRAQLTQLSQYKGVLQQTHGIMASQVRTTIPIIPCCVPLKPCHHPTLLQSGSLNTDTYSTSTLTNADSFIFGVWEWTVCHDNRWYNIVNRKRFSYLFLHPHFFVLMPTAIMNRLHHPPLKQGAFWSTVRMCASAL